MPADNDLDPVDRWLGQQVWPMSPPNGTYERITKRARRRRVRKAVASVGSAAAVVAAIAVAVPLGLSSGLGSSPQHSVAAGNTQTQRPRPSASSFANGKLGHTPTPSPATATPTSTPTPGITSPGYVPPNFKPFSVTFESQDTGWVIGPAGTPGQCGPQGNSTICTSIARTEDGGQTWYGLPAPEAVGPNEATGVSGLRFLDTTYGWAYGPDLYSTTDGGETWSKVATNGYSVTDLETTYGRAYALFGQCSSPAGTDADVLDNCTSFTLETTVAGSGGDWTPVAGVPGNLSSASGKYGSAVLEIGGSTGYLVAPDGELYAGPVGTAGGAWHEVGRLPCPPGAASAGGLPGNLMLAPAGTTSTGTTLAVVCAQPAVQDTVLYESGNGGASWNLRASAGAKGISHIGMPQSLTALADGTLILATENSLSGSAGLYRLTSGATAWQPAALENETGPTGDLSFSYVGMTSTTQGVAIGSDSAFTGIWMTTDGGQTWTPRQIKRG